MMLTILSVIYMVLLSAFVWRLRGGALRTFLNIKVGTQVTRLLTTSFLALNVALITGNWILFPLITIALMIGLIVAAWGPYMGMGHHATPAVASWIDIFPKSFKLIKHSRQWDFVGLTACGFILFFLLTVISSYIINPLILLALPMYSLAFAGCYAVASKLPLHKFPIIPGLVSCFTETRVYQHEEWAEVFVGLLVGIALCIFLI